MALLSHFIPRLCPRFMRARALLFTTLLLASTALPPLHAAKFTGEPEIQREPLSPEESLRSLRIEEGLRIELVAAEPLTTDPVDIAWDETGRMFVVETIGYNRPENAKPRSRIRLLEDTNGDGRMDKGTTFAENLDYAQGILPSAGGLIVTTNTGILFLRDADGDGKADVNTVLFECTPSINVDRQMSAPRRGLDNWIYVNLGLFKKELTPPGQPERRLEITTNVRFHLRSGAIERASGTGQFGKTFDDWGRQFFSMNRNPALFAVLPYTYLERNPTALLTRSDEDVVPAGGDGKVYPLQTFRTTSSAHAGTFTAACGTGVYRGDVLGGDFAGSLFVCEPTGALVTRWILEPSGASFKARRAQPGREFLASTDEWFRPVNITTGPDGALYVVDMYRRFMDGARFFPDDYVAANDMGAGMNRGRIYRVVPDKPVRLRPAAPLPNDSAERIALLEHPNGWHRDTAHRLLVESADIKAIGAVEKLFRESARAQGRLHALWVLEGLNGLKEEHVAAALRDAEPGVIENALWLAPRFLASSDAIRRRVLELAAGPAGRVCFAALLAAGDIDSPAATRALIQAGVRHSEDSWMRAAILSSPLTQSGSFLPALWREPAFASRGTQGRIELVSGLARVVAARGNAAELAPLLAALGDKGAAANTWMQMAVIGGLAEGLRGQKTDTLPRTLSALLATPPPELSGELQGLRQAVAAAGDILGDRTRPIPERIAAITLIEHLPAEQAASLLGSLTHRREPAEIQKAAVNSLPRLNRRAVTPVLYDQLNEMGSVARTAVVQYLQSGALEFLQRIKAGSISPSLVDAAGRWGFLNSNFEEIRLLGQEIFGKTEGDRKKLVRRYAAAIAGLEGSAVRGKEVFAQTCIACHRFRGTGNDVGPDISDVRIKTAEMLLSDILDPNSTVEPRWEAFSIRADNDRAVVGIIASETNDAIVVKSVGGSETLPRSSVQTSAPLGVSLMPEGLEATLTEQRMADLLAYLRSME